MLLLPPRSALPVPPHARTRMLLRRRHALLLRLRRAGSRSRAAAPSIFRAAEFGRYVVTRFLADADFYGHRPTVCIQPHPSWVLCALLGLLIPAVGSSLFAGPAYQGRPTRCLQFQGPTLLGPLLPIRSLRMRRHNFCTGSPSHSLYPTDLPGTRCPEGHFGGNQLPDSSIGLSPLCPGPAIELNVRTAQDLHQSFPWLHPAQA